jgi:hypothetical protein
MGKPGHRAGGGLGGRTLGKIKVGDPRQVLLLALEDSDRRLQDRTRKLIGDEPIPGVPALHNPHRTGPSLGDDPGVAGHRPTRRGAVVRRARISSRHSGRMDTTAASPRAIRVISQRWQLQWRAADEVEYVAADLPDALQELGRQRLAKPSTSEQAVGSATRSGNIEPGSHLGDQNSG